MSDANTPQASQFQLPIGPHTEAVLKQLVDAYLAVERTFLRAADSFDIELSELRTITLLWIRGAMPMSQLAREANVSTSAMSRIARRLAAYGYVCIEPDQRDARRLIVSHMGIIPEVARDGLLPVARVLIEQLETLPAEQARVVFSFIASFGTAVKSRMS